MENEGKKNWLVRNIPNLITSLRLIGAIIMIFLRGMSVSFFIVYAICGLSDAFDGFIARKTHSESKFGSVLDSICDLVFYSVMAWKIFPTMQKLLSIGNWIVIIVPTALHIIAYIICAIKFRKFSAIHTYANKALGAIVFIFPFSLIGGIPALYNSYIYGFGVIAIYGAIEINLIHLIAKYYNTKNKSVFFVKKNDNEVEQRLLGIEENKNLTNKY